MTILFSIDLPWGWSDGKTKKWFSSYYHRKIGEWKSFEWQTDYFGWTHLFKFQVDLIPTGHDHAGVGISLTILGFMLDAKLYDSRHWDEDTNSWQKYDHQKSEEPYVKEPYVDESLLAAYSRVAKDLDHRANIARQAYLETPEGQEEVRVGLERLREEKRLRGLAYKAANISKNGS